MNTDYHKRIAPPLVQSILGQDILRTR